MLAPLAAPHSADDSIDPGSAQSRPPGTLLYEIELENERRMLADSAERLAGGGLAVVRRGQYQELGAEELTDKAPQLRRFVLGTDHLGRDLLSRLLHGLRNSLAVALSAALLSTLLGLAIGLAAGGFGRIVDRTVMRLVDVAIGVPKLFLVLAVVAVVEPSVPLLIAILTATTWMPTARLVRARVLALSDRDFVLAATVSGCSPWRRLLHHQLPHVAAMAVMLAVLRIGNLVLLESTLSFLGAGLAPPTPSLGGMVAEAAQLASPSWWTVVFPGTAVALPCLLSNWLANQLIDSPRFGS